MSGEIPRNTSNPNLQPNIIIDARSAKPRWSRRTRIAACAAATAVAAGAGVAWWLHGGGEKSRVDAKVSHQEIRKYSAYLSQTVGELDTYSTIRIKQTVRQALIPHNPFVNLTVPVTSTYPATTPGIAEFCLPGIADISTTRKDPNQTPRPNDKVKIKINRSLLSLCNVRVQTNAIEGKSDTMTVKNGQEVAVNGKPLPIDKQSRVFAPDGDFETGALELGGKSSAAANAVEAAHFGNVDLEKGMHTAELQIGTVAAENPDCIGLAFREVSPDTLIKAAYTDAVVKNGYTAAHVSFEFDNDWPAPGNLPNEKGKTYPQLLDDLKQSMGTLAGTDTFTMAPTCSFAPGVGIDPATFDVGK